MTTFQFKIRERRQRDSLTGLSVEIKGALLKEFVAALDDLKLRKRDHVAMVQKTEPEFVVLLSAHSAEEGWSRLAQVARGYTLTLDDLDLYHLRRYYSIWLKNSVPERPGEEVSVMFDDQEMVVYFAHDAERDALTNVPTKGETWIDPLEDKASK
jgi:hypothetical protein